MELIKTWQWVLALAIGLVFFVVFSAGLGLWTYLKPSLRFATSITPKDLGVEFEDVTIATADGLKLAAWLVPAEVETDKAIILLHGYPADKGDILWSTVFLRENYNLLYLDFRYFGKSQGSYTTIGIRETADVLAAVKFLSTSGMKKIGVWGFSMGGAAALMALSETQEIDAVASDSSYASLALMAEEVYRQVPGLNKAIAWLMTRSAKLFLNIDLVVQSPVMIVKETRVPILLIHSQTDQVIPFSHALMLQNALAPNEPVHALLSRLSFDYLFYSQNLQKYQ